MTRLLSGLVLLAAVGSAVWLAPWPWLLLLAGIVAVLGFIELARLCDGLGAPVPRALGAAVTAGAVVAVGSPWLPPVALVGAAVLVTASIGVAAGAPDRKRLAGLAALLSGSLYLGVPMGALAAVRLVEGREAVCLLLVTVIASDTAQYYTGRLFGRRPLAPRISPKKTVEGAVGGMIGGTVALAWLGAAWLPQLALPARVLLGVALVSAGIVGDLLESVIKRAADVKDSSALIPGHGGVLDRIDALLLASLVYFLVLRVLAA